MDSQFMNLFLMTRLSGFLDSQHLALANLAAGRQREAGVLLLSSAIDEKRKSVKTTAEPIAVGLKSEEPVKAPAKTLPSTVQESNKVLQATLLKISDAVKRADRKRIKAKQPLEARQREALAAVIQVQKRRV